MNTIQAQLLESLNEFTAFARKRLADPELAADAVQDGLLKALKATDQVRDEKNVKAWFYRILRRTIKVRLHRARQQLKERLTQTCRLCAKHG